MRLNDNADAGADVRLIGEFPAQPAAEYPGQHQHRQPDEREKQINSPFCDDPIEKMEHRVEHCGRIQVHVISSGYALGHHWLKGFGHFRELGAHPFKFAQRRQFHLRLARIRAMDGFAVMSQRLLREPFGITRFFGAFRPRIPIRMQADTFDAQAHER